MKKYYSMDIESNYKINIIDKNITLLNIVESQQIILTDDGYTVNKN